MNTVKRGLFIAMTAANMFKWREEEREVVGEGVREKEGQTRQLKRAQKRAQGLTDEERLVPDFRCQNDEKRLRVINRESGRVSGERACWVLVDRQAYKETGALGIRSPL